MSRAAYTAIRYRCVGIVQRVALCKGMQWQSTLWPTLVLLVVLYIPSHAAQFKRAIHLKQSSPQSGGEVADLTATAGSGAVSSQRRSLHDTGSLEDAYNYTALECSRYDPTYAQIGRDLDIHRQLGTSLDSTLYIASRLGSVNMRGITVGFFGGRAFLLTPTSFPGLSHHAKLHLAYMRMLLHLEATWGAHLPDVAFVLTTSDTPRYVSPLVVNTSSPAPRLPPGHSVALPFEPGPYPVLGICKSDYWPDLLLVPNFHFHMKLYDNTSLAAIPEYNATRWDKRAPILFGRFSRYRTNRVAADASTFKLGRGGRPVCYNGNQTCPTREHFIEKVAAKHPDQMDVRFSAKVPLAAHTAFKYLVNLEGQGISSRLEQLLPLGSLVLKEASGYYAYYYRSLLQPGVHLLEFWRSRPEEVLEALQWAREHDEEAAAMAEAGRQLAARFLTGNGRTCYWYRLLHGLRSVLSYTPDLSHWPEAQPLRQVVEEELPGTPYGKALYDLPWAP